MIKDLHTMLNKAIEIANSHHGGQVDKGGQPYILHPLVVMNNVEKLDEKIVAILHDVVEDTDCTFDSLRRFFTDEIVSAVHLLTKRKGQSSKDYMMGVKHNELARVVKIADLKHNMDLSRLDGIADRDVKRNEQYEKLLKELE